MLYWLFKTFEGGDYVPFEGICLTDTFQMYEKEDLVDALLVDNSARRRRQKQLDIRVIMGNPPYSVGQDSANDNNKNVSYPALDGRIRETYAARSTATLKNALYDSYIRAVRWASDRIGQHGVIGFVTNAGFLEANTADGLRQCLAEDFSSLYVFHLRGNQRTSGEQSRKEGGKIFGSGSRAPIAISLLVKNPTAGRYGQIHFHDIGDYLSRDEKLEKIVSFGSIAGLSQANRWRRVTPDEHGDWLKQRVSDFEHFMPLDALFGANSGGVKSNRDPWVFNYSRKRLVANVNRLLSSYNDQRASFSEARKVDSTVTVDGYIDTDPAKIAWTVNLKKRLEQQRSIEFQGDSIRKAIYRPFVAQHVYFDRELIERPGRNALYFPRSDSSNIVISVVGTGSGKEFSALAVCSLPEYHLNANGQCFPLYAYESDDEGERDTNGELFSVANPGRVRRDAITGEGLAHFQDAYPGETISKEDVFYYVYGLLHSPDYRERYADNLGKQLPRIPRVKSATDFRAFSQAGRALAELHLNYETVPMYPATVTGGVSDADYRVEKMKYARTGKDRDLTTLIYNPKITVTGFPLEAYDYVVNGKPALDWVVERQCVKTDKDSGIVNDANDWAIDTMHNPRYPLELFLRVITVSLETMKIVRGLPPLDILEGVSVAQVQEPAIA